ncbi:hypothetical protein MARBORIA2_16920 [Methanobrevibacter arboriphilus]|uniref:Uncharacterized protein n=2 Tax=Methanobrevibacter arboriphilus TaxID=39441 RepID=A0ACA8R104_METAZ|nr:hypothetical protein [Methanobrevibacter arboriphilus]MCC7562801.1 hypothetical protein [Methanobrevibacter arboriphilus]BBL61072.1 hypothetical protein MarbSA_01120 [Methanobrevibacter arboriphilus]GLI12602.1 hypothetical protein MARBORIA2_16920 [Methanobrevibacter arboriphilus]
MTVAFCPSKLTSIIAVSAKTEEVIPIPAQIIKIKAIVISIILFFFIKIPPIIIIVEFFHYDYFKYYHY